MTPESPEHDTYTRRDGEHVVRAVHRQVRAIASTYTRPIEESGTLVSRRAGRSRLDDAEAVMAQHGDGAARSAGAGALAPRRGAPRRPGPGARQRDLPDRDPRARGPRRPGSWRDAELASLRQILERELDTLRGYINQLRPSLGEAAGLDEALRDSADAVSQRSACRSSCASRHRATQLHEAARTVVLRVAQEALRNIAKHSGASRAWLVTASVVDTRRRAGNGCSR